MRIVILLILLLPRAVFANVEGDFRFIRIDADQWRAEYCLAQPVEALRFERPVADLRKESWSSASEELELVHAADGSAVLRRTDGKPFECAALDLRTWTKLPEKNYYAFSPFSDGGMSVYTGYYLGSASIDGEWQEMSLRAEFRGREDEQVITREPARLLEQFVYFGKQKVLETDAVIAVVDPAMPQAARRGVLETVPAVNRLLEETFDFRPASPYMIFMATDFDAFDGYSVKGGALRGQIEFMLKGRGVLPLIEEHPAHFPKTTAHEVLHLWQAEHWFETLGDDHPWVHEGSADALAVELMRRAGIYDAATYEARWASIEKECVEALRETSIHAAPGTGRFDVVYSCGALVNRLVGEALNPESPGAGIIRFWRTMAAWPADERMTPSEELFFRSLEKLGVAANKRAALRKFLDAKTAAPEKTLLDLRDALR